MTKKTLENSNGNVNKLQGEYLSSNLNQVWTVDITTINKKYYWFFIVDLASRRIVHYDVAEHDYTAAEAVYCLTKALTKEYEVKPHRPVEFVHTDSGSIFVSKEWKEFLLANKIFPSSSNSTLHQNQVSERFNRTFKTILREKLNKMLNKANNKTSTFQLLGAATKYNFGNVQKLTDELILYYNSEKGHNHLNHLPPDTWANRARQLPEQKYLFKEKENLCFADIKNPLLELASEDLLDRIEIAKETSAEKLGYEDLKKKEGREIMKNLIDLESKAIIPFVPLSKNDNSEEAKIIREYKNNVGSLELITQVNEKQIDLSTLDSSTRKMYDRISEDTNAWKETDVKYLETIILQNQILLLNIEELKEKTNKLKLQNEELLDINYYLRETAEKAEAEKELALARKEKRKKARKLPRRDYISINEFYDIVFKYIYRCEDSRYILSRNRVAYFLMYFTGLRVSNLLLLTVRNIRELMYDKVGRTVPMIKGGKPNQLVSLGEDAQKVFSENFYDDICLILKDKDDNYPAFTSEKTPLHALHRVTFTQDLNDTLKYASGELHKKISCHSFRITFITEGLEQNIPIQVMKDVVGHKNIQTTELYNRHNLNNADFF